MVKGFLHGRVDLTSSLCCLAACPVCAPPLDFTHRLHFCRFHPRCCSVYSASAAATGGRRGGNRKPALHQSAPGTFFPTTDPPSPSSSSITSSSGKPSPICLPTDTHSLLTFKMFQLVHNPSDKLAELWQDAREEQTKLRPLWRSAPHCWPRHCDVTFV